jgi:hypothetical protein
MGIRAPCGLRCEDRKPELVSELGTSQSTGGIELHANLPELYRRKVTELREILHDEPTRPQAFDIIRSLIDHIE